MVDNQYNSHTRQTVENINTQEVGPRLADILLNGIGERLATVVAELIAESHNKLTLRLEHIQETLKSIMSTQADIDALVQSESSDLATIGQSLSDVNDAVALVSKEVADLIASAPAGLDISKLQDAQADLDSKTEALGQVAAAIKGIVPTAPAGGTDGGETTTPPTDGTDVPPTDTTDPSA